MSKDTTASIIKTSHQFLTGTFASRVTGMCRDVAMAMVFGSAPIIASFMVAYRMSNLLRRVLGEGAMNAAFVPHFEHHRAEDSRRAASFFLSLFLSLTIVLLTIIGVGEVGLFAWLHWVRPDKANVEILILTMVMLPSLLFICLFGIQAALLQCEQRYFASAFVPVLFNIVWIAGVFAARTYHTQKGVLLLAWFVVGAFFVQWVALLPKTLAILKKLGADASVPWTFFSKEVRALIKPLGLGIIGVAAAQVNSALDPLFARYADSSGPAYLWYAIRLQQLPLALFAIALSAALLPPLSRSIRKGKEEEYTSFVSFALRRSTSLMIPLTIAIFVLGTPAIVLIYGHGKFGDHSIAETTRCLWGYAFGLPAMTGVLIFAQAFNAQKRYRITTVASSASCASNILLNTLFVFVFHWGAMSVAIATSISAYINLLILAIPFYKQNKMRQNTSLIRTSAKVLVASIIAFAATGFASSMIFDSLTWAPLFAQKTAFPSTLASQIPPLVVLTGIFFGVLFVAAYLLRAHDLLALLKRTPTQL
ncbi:murein biosynthesis integral membrane protein MurJ [Simkania negevensis]|uniref:Lipid II flippase n=1 Tax=Simkania negevensis TaxID=83561 RepID=A0ABS3ARH5_9BACT|nr:murein biosynthesis integral membrane protein MurJ [Simkania negevensis]